MECQPQPLGEEKQQKRYRQFHSSPSLRTAALAVSAWKLQYHRLTACGIIVGGFPIQF
jgi:hypothetical protein